MHIIDHWIDSPGSLHSKGMDVLRKDERIFSRRIRF